MVFHANYPLSWLICHFYVNSLGVISSIEGKQFTKKKLNIQNLLRGFKRNTSFATGFPWIFSIPIDFPIDFPLIFPWIFHDFPCFSMIFPWFYHGFSMILSWFSMIFPWFSHGFPMDFPFPSVLSRDLNDVEARGVLRRALRDASLRALRGTTAAGARCG